MLAASKLQLMHRVSNKFTWHRRQAVDDTEMMQHPAADAITDGRIACTRCQSVY